jgi:hypothetical protein
MLSYSVCYQLQATCRHARRRMCTMCQATRIHIRLCQHLAGWLAASGHIHACCRVSHLLCSSAYGFIGKPLIFAPGR